ncbi:unnamed protein product, partial [Ectocarpus sp. 12 AP-2014]
MLRLPRFLAETLASRLQVRRRCLTISRDRPQIEK